MVEKPSIALPYSNYVQSANTLFHFMNRITYLTRILSERRIVPRYCIEDIGYLNISVEGQQFNKIAVLQKCFCDIPFHKLTDTFELKGSGEIYESLSDEEKSELERNNSHPDYYGSFAIAFSKKWGETNNLQPVQYVNEKSDFATEFSNAFTNMLNAESIPEVYANDLLRRLSYMKPLRGIMNRPFESKALGSVKVNLIKNFHDEREWRYVPCSEALADAMVECVIANPNVLGLLDGMSGMSRVLESDTYQRLWLTYNYDDIRYIIVPDLQNRINIIETILSIPESQFDCPEQAQRERHILISKILVLDEIRKDW